jgi:hypothetical protein
MNKLSFKAAQIYATVLVGIFIGSVLLWEQFHGGVTTHHILQRKELAGISNWWGLLLLPLLCWISFHNMQKRLKKLKADNQTERLEIKQMATGFIGALIYGICLATAFSFENTVFMDYQVDCLVPLLLFVPMYRSEYLIGFVVGMTVTFGAVLPLGFALIVAIPSAIIFLYLRPLVLQLFQLFFSKKEKKK